MEVNLSNRGLFSFDAAKARSGLLKDASHRRNGGAPSKSTPVADGRCSHSNSGDVDALRSALPIIARLNLSYNSIHLFTGGETMRGLTVLDLSWNALTQLNGRSLPSTLTHLNLAHNQLNSLMHLVRATPRLVELHLGHNQLTDAAVRDLPDSLAHLNVEHNALSSLDVFSGLVHLSTLNLAENRLEAAEVLVALRPLRSLRQLDLRGNPVCIAANTQANTNAPATATSRSSSVASSPENSRGSHRRRLFSAPTSNADGMAGVLQLLSSLLPRLAHLNGEALSQASASRLCSSAHARSAAVDRSIDGPSTTSTFHHPQHRSNSSLNTTTASTAEPPMEMRLMQAKVRELRRLLLDAQDTEVKARQRRALLTENVKSTAVVIDRQAGEVVRLQTEIVELRTAKARLRVPVAAAEESFEQVHASLLASKAKAAATSGM